MNWKQAFALGLCSVGAYKGEPAAYLFNGVQLPVLPEWDREAYPYAVIAKDGDVYYLHYASTPITIKENGYVRWQSPTTNAYRCGDDLFGGWRACDVLVIFAPKAVWGNHDICMETDGTVYLKATDPIPVYE